MSDPFADIRPYRDDEVPAVLARLLRDPRALAPWYNATGTLAYVLGMLVAAFALAQLAGTS